MSLITKPRSATRANAMILTEETVFELDNMEEDIVLPMAVLEVSKSMLVDEHLALMPSSPDAVYCNEDDYVLCDLDAPSRAAVSTNGDAPQQEAVQQPLQSTLADEYDALHGLGDAGAVASSSTSSAAGDVEEVVYQYYYELPDAEEGLLERIEKSLEKSEEEKKLDEELTEMMVREANRQRLKSQRKYRERQEERSVFVCYVCSMSVVDEETMRTHVKEQHIDKKKGCTFKCRYCSEAYARKKNLQEHEARVHYKQLKYFPCDHCSQVYSRQEMLTRHLSEKHNRRVDGSVIKSKDFSCTRCDRAFGLQMELQFHSYYCGRKEAIAQQRAERKAMERGVAKEALKKAEDKRAVVPLSPTGRIAVDKACPACGLVCASRQSRNRHIQRAHADIAEALLAESASQTPMDPGQEDKVAARPFSCSVCMVFLANKAALTIHERRAHGKGDMSKMFACGKCGKEFPLASELRKHEKLGEGLAMCRSRGRSKATPPATFKRPAEVAASPLTPKRARGGSVASTSGTTTTSTTSQSYDSLDDFVF